MWTKDEREAIGITIQQLSDYLGTDVRTVVRWECIGYIPEYLKPRLELLWRIYLNGRTET
jgi:transcriptional regulator with XRE-family HTH domain